MFLPGESQGLGEPGGLPSMGSHRVGHNWSDLAAAGKNTRVGCHALIQRICPTKDSNPVTYISCIGRWVLYQYCHLGNPLSGYAAAAKSLQSCPTLCDPRGGSPPGSPVPGILQARTLERVAISFSNAWKWKVKVKSLSPVRLFATPWTAAHQAPLSVGVSRQEYWSGVPLSGCTNL